VGCKFSTIYADPPWAYENEASRAAASNHYRTMAVDEICALPVRELAENNAHLHLWTTNAFLREAFDVIDAWGFRYTSCFVWLKERLGMGNYWRVSHEFLLLGVRGSLTFRDRSIQSWLKHRRGVHSRKPWPLRLLIERVSPGPYLELFGREEIPNSAWTAAIPGEHWFWFNLVTVAVFGGARRSVCVVAMAIRSFAAAAQRVIDRF
jgi:N6-adenosine-specific RNA methylase IME4